MPSTLPLFLVVLLSVLGGLVLAVLAAPQLWYPLGFDQAVYAACGYAIKNGGVPIRDCFETKQMGIMVMYALPMLFTLSPIAIHAFTLLWTAVTSIVIGRVGANLFGARAGVLAGVLYWLVVRGHQLLEHGSGRDVLQHFLGAGVLAADEQWRVEGEG
ncbi:MAG: hypothetical protein HC853_15565 [Anaerolineae bacterium]|nr:hypothetical protein [Anaerolineae bacterium]